MKEKKGLDFVDIAYKIGGAILVGLGFILEKERTDRKAKMIYLECKNSEEKKKEDKKD